MGKKVQKMEEKVVKMEKKVVSVRPKIKKNNGENIFLHFLIPKMKKIMGKRSKPAIFPHYWNGEKEWGKNSNNGKKLLMKMGKNLSWIRSH